MAETVSVKLWLQGGRRFAQEAQQAARSTRELGREMRQTGRDAREASGGLGLVQRVIGLIRPAALITGLGLAAGGLSAVAAGGVAVGSALGPLAGALAPAAAGMVALKTSMGLVKVAGMGVSASMAGVFDDFSKATPATDAFAKTVKGFVPQLLSLKNAVQGRILGGLSDGLKSAAPLIGKLSPALKTTASVLGGLAREAGSTAGTLGGPLSRILTTNAGLIRNVGRAGINMAVVFVRILDAARPLTAWIGRLALSWSKSALAATEAGAKSGKLAAFFDKTRVAMSRVGRIASDVAVGLFNIGKAGSGLGGSLLTSIVRGAEAFKDWTASASGRNALVRWFEDARPVVYELAGLVGDVAAAFGRVAVGAMRGLPGLISQVRSLVPILERVVAGTAAAFGPALVGLVTAFATAFEPLSGSSGPLVFLVNGLAGVAKAITWLTTSVPGGSAALSAFFGVFAVSTAIGLGAFASTMFGAGRGIKAIGTAATFARGAVVAFGASTFATRIGLAALSVQAGIAAVATKALAAGQWLLNAAMAANPIVLVVAGLVALGAAFYLAYTKVGWFRDGVQAVFGWLKANWPMVLAILTGPVGLAVLAIVRHWGTIKKAAGSVVGFVRSRFGSMVSFLMGIPGRVAGIGGRMFNGLREAASRVVSAIADRFRQLVDFVKRIPSAIADAVKSVPGIISGAVGGINIPGVPGLASGGTVAQPGWAVVGERGPELLRLPGASTVFDAGQTAMALPSPAPVRSPRVRQRPGSGAERIDVHVRHEPIPVTFRDEVIGEATGRAVTTYTARKR